MTAPKLPAAGKPLPPGRRQALIEALTAERFGYPVRSDRPRPPHTPDSKENQQQRAALLDDLEDESE